MAEFLERIDSVPVQFEDFSFAFESWLTNLAGQLNEQLDIIEEAINLYDNGILIPQFTSAEITALSATAVDGTMWYATDSVPPNVVIKIDGSLRQLTTAAWP